MTNASQRKTNLIASKASARPETAWRIPIAEEHVRFAAYGVFQTRVRAGIPGNSVSDWLEAERQIVERQTTARR